MSHHEEEEEEEAQGPGQHGSTEVTIKSTAQNLLRWNKPGTTAHCRFFLILNKRLQVFFLPLSVARLGADRILAPLFLPRAPLQLGAEAGKLWRERATNKARMQGHRDLTKACSRTVLGLHNARALSFYGIPKSALLIQAR